MSQILVRVIKIEFSLPDYLSDEQLEERLERIDKGMPDFSSILIEHYASIQGLSISVD